MTAKYSAADDHLKFLEETKTTDDELTKLPSYPVPLPRTSTSGFQQPPIAQPRPAKSKPGPPVPKKPQRLMKGSPSDHPSREIALDPGCHPSPLQKGLPGDHLKASLSPGGACETQHLQKSIKERRLAFEPQQLQKGSPGDHVKKQAVLNAGGMYVINHEH